MCAVWREWYKPVHSLICENEIVQVKFRPALLSAYALRSLQKNPDFFAPLVLYCCHLKSATSMLRVIWCPWGFTESLCGGLLFLVVRRVEFGPFLSNTGTLVVRLRSSRAAEA